MNKINIKELINFSDAVNLNTGIHNNPNNYVSSTLELIKISKYDKDYISLGKVWYEKNTNTLIFDNKIHNCRKLKIKELELIKEYLLKGKGFSYYLSPKRVLLLKNNTL